MAAIFQIGGPVHEVGHMIGFWHEHQRSDRNKYVTINSKNLNDTKDASFSVLGIGRTKNKLSYDYSSIMHYFAGVSNLSVGVLILMFLAFSFPLR